MSALNNLEFSLPKQTCISLGQFITVQAAAELSGYNMQYLRRLLRAGKLDSIKVGQLWLIRLDSLEAYMNWAEQKDDQRCGPKGSQIVQSSTSVNPS
jgi:excisionase family DNA binding protein